MSRLMSHDEIRADYIRRAEERNPGKGQEIGESYIFLESKLLFMKHRFSEYKKMMRGDTVDRVILHRYLRSFFRDARNAFLDGVVLEIVNFIDKKGDAERGHLSLFTFMSYLNDEDFKRIIDAVYVKANSIIRRRNESVAHWGKVATVEGKAISISIDEVGCAIELIVEAMDYIGEKLLGLEHFAEKSESYDPWELDVPGGVEHVITELKYYEWLSYKHREYMKNGEPFVSPSWFDIFDSTEQGEDERRKQKERIFVLINE